MRNFNLLIWLTQLGCSVAFPMVGFILLAVWLRQRFDLGVWIIFAGLAVGLICGAEGFRSSLKAMDRLASRKDESAAHAPDLPQPPIIHGGTHENM